MLAYTIAAAVNCGLFERIVVSTESTEIGEISELYGAEYIARPQELASDTADLVGVSLHVLETLAAKQFHPRALCQLMPNCPLRRSEDISNQFRQFEDKKRIFQISVVPYRTVYPQWAVTEDPDGGRFVFGPEFMVNSQDLQHVYCPTGAIWWARTKDFVEQGAFYGRPYHLAPMDPDRGIDIDNAEDLALAELIVRGLRDRNGVSPLEVVNAQPFHPRFVNA